MNRDRSHWVAIGLLLTSLAGVALGVTAMSGLGNTASGDLLVSSASGTMNALLALGAFLLLGLDVAHARSRPSQAGRPASGRDVTRY